VQCKSRRAFYAFGIALCWMNYHDTEKFSNERPLKQSRQNLIDPDQCFSCYRHGNKNRYENALAFPAGA
jgi:hypothetical protein